MTNVADKVLSKRHRSSEKGKTMSFLISDMAREHILRKDGNWYEMPVEEADLPMLDDHFANH